MEWPLFFLLSAPFKFLLEIMYVVWTIINTYLFTLFKIQKQCSMQKEKGTVNRQVIDRQFLFPTDAHFVNRA